MKTIFIIHGSFGNPDENWFPWLKQELEKDGMQIFIPAFPTPEHQSLASWQEVFSPYLQYIDKETIFVGHSLGPAFILDVLEHIDTPITSCFFVSGFLGLLGDPTFDNLNTSFTNRSFDWDHIYNICPKFFLYHGYNDPYVRIETAQAFATHLKTTTHYIENGGHLNTAAGYTTFEQLRDDIQKVTSLIP